MLALVLFTISVVASAQAEAGEFWLTADEISTTRKQELNLAVPAGQKQSVELFEVLNLAAPAGQKQSVESPEELNLAAPAGQKQQVESPEALNLAVPAGQKQSVESPEELNLAAPAGQQQSVELFEVLNLAVPAGQQQSVESSEELNLAAPAGQKQQVEPFGRELDFLDEALLKARIEIQKKAAASGGGGGGSSGIGGGAEVGAADAESAQPGEDLATEKAPSGSAKDLPPPPDVDSGKDDDIVARQLRELATKETDPEVRENLWNEYRKYRKGR